MTESKNINASILEPDDFPQFKTWLSSILTDSIVGVTFTKSDGTTRFMKATLSEKYIKPTQIIENIEGKKTKKTNDAVLAVWDTESAGWRSFRLDRIISIHIYFE